MHLRLSGSGGRDERGGGATEAASGGGSLPQRQDVVVEALGSQGQDKSGKQDLQGDTAAQCAVALGAARQSHGVLPNSFVGLCRLRGTPRARGRPAPVKGFPGGLPLGWLVSN